jgi:hypothetical protein
MADDDQIHLNQLLAGPIIAMNDAQADAAASFYELFEAFAFETQPPAVSDPDLALASVAAEPAARRLKMISFVAERRAPDGSLEKREISMPLLQMIPIGGIAIDSAKIEFSLAIDTAPDMSPAPLASIASAVAGAAAAPATRPIALKGRMARTQGGAGDSGAAGNLKVEINLKQVDLPAGYLDMIAETQGGTSRPLPQDDGPAPPAEPAPPVEPSAPPASKGGEAAPPLFTARLESKPLMQFGGGTLFKLFLAFEVFAKRLGPDGLAVTMTPNPRNSLRITAGGEIRLTGLGAEPIEMVAIEGKVGKVTPGGEIAVQIDGSTVQKDGSTSTQSVRIVVGRAPALPT